MPVLNESLDWNQIAAADKDARDAFTRTPTKTLLSPSEMLCRFITTEEKDFYKRNAILAGKWWKDWQTTVQMLSRWKAAQAAPKAVIRAKLAITSDFNSKLDSLVQIILNKPVYAWKGIARYQDDKLQGITYIGGESQIYLPHLTANSEELSSDVAYLHCFTSIDSLG